MLMLIIIRGCKANCVLMPVAEKGREGAGEWGVKWAFAQSVCECANGRRRLAELMFIHTN